MKNYLFFIILIIFSLLTSCKKEELGPLVEVNQEIEQLIKEIYPKEGESFSRYFSPSIKFNYPIDTVFQHMVYGKTRNLKIEYTYRLLNSNNILIPLAPEVFSNDSLVLFHPALLPNNAPLKLQCSAVLKIEDNGEWYDAIRDNVVFGEYYTVNFTTNNSLPGGDVTFQNLTNHTNNYILPNEDIVLEISKSFNEEINLSPYYNLKLTFSSFTLKDIEGNNISGTVSFSGNRITFSTSEMTYNKTYNVNAIVEWKYSYNSNNWNSCGVTYTYSFSLTTIITDNPDDLNVLYSYPCLNQYHFLKNEYSQGYIRFNEIPEGLDANAIGNSYEVKVKITDYETNDFQIASTSFSSDSLFFSYDFPSQFIQNQKVYRVSFHKFETGNLGQEIYGYYFRSSKFDTFIDKINSLGSTFSTTNIYMTGIHSLYFRIDNNQEAFDYWECKTNMYKNIPYSCGLITTENLIEQSSWFDRVSISKLYELVETYPMAIKWRDLNFYGLKPRYRTAVMYSDNSGHPGYINPEVLSQGAAMIPPPEYLRIYNFVVIIANMDNMDLNSYYQNNGMEQPDLHIAWFLENNLWFRLKYTIPGLNHNTSYADYRYYY